MDPGFRIRRDDKVWESGHEGRQKEQTRARAQSGPVWSTVCQATRREEQGKGRKGRGEPVGRK